MLNRQQQVIIGRLRTGHNRLRWHMFNKLRIGVSGRCDCGGAKQDAEHVLQDCNIFADLRYRYWPQSTSVEAKLHGCLSELINTANFILETGLVV